MPHIPPEAASGLIHLELEERRRRGGGDVAATE
jgi:hypothetical protein